jgi:TetR/AcrR family transcriptional repressor of nem operon
MALPQTRKTQSHERIVDVAARAIRRAGYRGFGVADIMKEAGLTHGGFYAHFPSRDALLVEAMQKAGRDNQVALSESMAKRMTKGDSRFAALVGAYLHDIHLERSDTGCVVAALASETTRQSETVQQEAKRRVTDLVELVRSALPEGVEREQAQVVAATLVGALQLARTLGGTAGRALLSQTRKALLLKFQPTSFS